jgi:hypothetical protein
MILLEAREYSVEELENIIAINKITSVADVLVSIKWVGNRNSPTIEESFIVDNTFWTKFQPKIINKDINFGEIFGKHSEIYGQIEDSDITVIKDPESILTFIKNNHSRHVYNHSFLSVIIDAYNDGEDAYGVCWDEFITENDIEVLKKIFNEE